MQRNKRELCSHVTNPHIARKIPCCQAVLGKQGSAYNFSHNNFPVCFVCVLLHILRICSWQAWQAAHSPRWNWRRRQRRNMPLWQRVKNTLCISDDQMMLFFLLLMEITESHRARHEIFSMPMTRVRLQVNVMRRSRNMKYGNCAEEQRGSILQVLWAIFFLSFAQPSPMMIVFDRCVTLLSPLSTHESFVWKTEHVRSISSPRSHHMRKTTTTTTKSLFSSIRNCVSAIGRGLAISFVDQWYIFFHYILKLCFCGFVFRSKWVWIFCMPINTPDTTVINLRDVTVVNGHMVAIDLCVCRPQAIIWQARVCVIRNTLQ